MTPIAAQKLVALLSPMNNAKRMPECVWLYTKAEVVGTKRRAYTGLMLPEVLHILWPL
jgi:hypothetical protein